MCFPCNDLLKPEGTWPHPRLRTAFCLLTSHASWFWLSHVWGGSYIHVCIQFGCFLLLIPLISVWSLEHLKDQWRQSIVSSCPTKVINSCWEFIVHCRNPGWRIWREGIGTNETSILKKRPWQSYKQKGKISSWKRLLSRNTSSRQLKVCSSKSMDFRGKWGHGLWSIYLRSRHFALFLCLHWVVFSGDVLLRNHICILKRCLQSCPRSPFICFLHTHRQKRFKMLKRPTSPVLCHRSDAGTMSSYVKTKLSVFSFLSSRALPSTDLHKFRYNSENGGVLSCPSQTPQTKACSQLSQMCPPAFC